jgi:uncharacterized glyoxalase superfamily protein PhnB/predicted TIM-barrel fold metal-dependent hydrolase
MTTEIAKPAQRVSPIPEGYHSVTPGITVQNAAEAIEFYKRAFGAEELSRMTAPDGTTVWHAEIRIGDSHIMLGDEMPDMGVTRAPKSLGGTASSLHLYVEDVDAAFERAVAAGATVAMPVSDQFWGDRYGTVLDPYGHLWGIATRKEILSEEEMYRRAAAFAPPPGSTPTPQRDILRPRRKAMGRFNLVSADSHVVEPVDLWTERIALAFRERAPRIRREESGEDVFYCDGVRLLGPARVSQAGKTNPDLDWSADAVYPGGRDPRARLGEMAVDGVEAEVLYPSVTMRIFEVPDPALQQACFAAYNAWIAEFCRQVPDRLKGVAVVALDDLDAAIAEARRAREMGLPGLMISIAGDDPNLYGTTAYDRFWAAAEDLEMPVSLHVITNRTPLSYTVIFESLIAFDVMTALANMVFGGLFDRFPRLKVVSAENDAGWAGYLVERMDRVFTQPRRNRGRDFPIRDRGMLPSAYVRRNFALTFIHDKTAVEARPWIGVENLMWSSDYPHQNSTWPNSAATLDYVFAGVPEDERRLMAAGNAERLYGLG